MSSHASDLHVVLGATGGIGSALVNQLAAGGHRVRAVHRNGGQVPAKVERIRADLNDPDDARFACRDATVVYHCAQPDPGRWLEEFPVMTFNVLEATIAAGAKLVYVDNCQVYGRAHGLITEQTQPRRAGPRGRVRYTIAEQLLAAHRSSRLRVTIGRCSDYYGPNGPRSALGTCLFGRAARGLRPRWAGELDAPHTLHYLEDTAKGLMALAARDESDGEVFHLPAAEPLTGREFLELLEHQLVKAPVPIGPRERLARISSAFITAPRQQFGESLPQYERAFVASSDKFHRTFGPIDTTPHVAAVEETLSWFRIYRSR